MAEALDLSGPAGPLSWPGSWGRHARGLRRGNALPPRGWELVVYGARLGSAKEVNGWALPSSLKADLEAVIWAAVGQYLARHPAEAWGCQDPADVPFLLHAACSEWLEKAYASASLEAQPWLLAYLERFLRVLELSCAEAEGDSPEPDVPWAQDGTAAGLSDLQARVRGLRRQMRAAASGEPRGAPGAGGPCGAPPPRRPAPVARQGSSLDGVLEGVQLLVRLRRLLSERPYLEDPAHQLHRWAEGCRSHLQRGELPEAHDHLVRLETELELDAKRLRAAFAKFDHDGSGALEAAEARHLGVYLGVGAEALGAAPQRGPVTLDALAAFVGRAGGIRALLERRRRRLDCQGGLSRSVLAHSRCHAQPWQPEPGARVRAHFRCHGRMSRSVRDARVLSVSPDGQRVTVEFGMGRWATSQDIPRGWIEHDADLIEALRDIGILDDEQHYWTVTLPAAEQQVAKALAPCQRSAISYVRTMATGSHGGALPVLVQRAAVLGIGEEQLWATLTWIRDLAPIIVHVELGRVGPCLLRDTHYRNQFETLTTGGLLCKATRTAWEHDLFGGAYDGAEAFERPKYGVLDVMNDPRGTLCAQHYGDSYLVLAGVRLRCTFSPEDSGGICASQLAVLDQYAHVLLEYGAAELLEVVRVASAPEGSTERIGDSQLLEHCRYKEAQIHGELRLDRHVVRLVAHDRHRGDTADFGEAQIRALCAAHGWELTWMEEERQRRIYQERRGLNQASPQACLDAHAGGGAAAEVPDAAGAVVGRLRSPVRPVSGGGALGLGVCRAAAAAGPLGRLGAAGAPDAVRQRAARLGVGALSPALREELSASLTLSPTLA